MRLYFFDTRPDTCGLIRHDMVALSLMEAGLAQCVMHGDILENAGKDDRKAGILALKAMAWCDIMCVQQSEKLSAISLFEMFRKNLSKPVVLDTDDVLDDALPNDPKGDIRVARWDIRKYVWRYVDAITCTNERLAGDLRSKFNKPVYVLPNQIDWGTHRWLRVAKKPKSIIRIGWSGAWTHYDDLYVLKDVFLPVLEKYKNVEIEVQGFREEKNVGFFPKHPRFKHKNFYVNHFEYPKRLGRLDIGLIPMANHSFNLKGKSDLKFLEYSTAKLATIASNRHPYKESIKDGVTGLLVGDDPSCWIEAIGYLVEKPERRRAIARNAREYVRNERTIQKNIHKWIDVYREIQKG